VKPTFPALFAINPLRVILIVNRA